MGLLNPTPGEAVDRITILDLKLLVAKLQYRDPRHFFSERLALHNHLNLLRAKLPDESGWVRNFTTSLDNFTSQLAATNKELWDLEDLLREEVKKDDSEGIQDKILGRLLRKQTELNDRRAFLVEQVNSLFGIETREKIYTETKV